MKYRRLTNNDYESMRHENDGNLTRGSLFVDEQGFVRWISVEDVMKMQGEGDYNGGSGYPAYNE